MKKKPSKASTGSKKAGRRDTHMMPGFSRGRLAEVLDVLANDSELGAVNLPAPINGELIRWATDAARFALRNSFAKCDLSQDERLSVYGLMAYAAEAGFSMALYRYAKELRDVPELAAWQRKRTVGGDLGRKTASQRREQKAQRIREKWAAMERAGERVTNDAVVAALKHEGVKVSLRTVQRAFSSKPAKRPKR
jgi:hypothetical protein